MGGSGSKTRKITIENQAPMSVIQVSECVVDRMKGKEETVRNQVAAQAATGLHQSGLDPFLYQPSLTSIQIRQATVDALNDNDTYWDKRIENLQKRHQEMQVVMETEFAKAMDEYKDKKSDKKEKKKDEPCVDRKSSIIACYKKYRNEPMRCAEEVQAFADCVEQKRASLIANRG